ncbi:MAG TPA: hypothetical protein VF483_04005 [Gemmatimonadaceae bacterium]
MATPTSTGQMLRRRLRGLLTFSLSGTVTGAVCGLALGALFLLVPGPKTITIRPTFPGAVLLVPMLWFGLAGALSGAAFAMLFMLAERHRTVAELRWYRSAAWAALPSLGALRLAGASWPLVAIGAVVGGAIGAAATSIAKRGRAHAPAEIGAPPT